MTARETWRFEVARERGLAAALEALQVCHASATTEDVDFLTRAVEATTHAVNIAEARVERAACATGDADD